MEHLKYVLVLVDEMFEGESLSCLVFFFSSFFLLFFPRLCSFFNTEMGPAKRAERIRAFLDLRSKNEALPFEPFLSLLDMPDHYVQYLAAQQVGTLLFAAQSNAREADLDVVLRWGKKKKKWRGDETILANKKWFSGVHAPQDIGGRREACGNNVFLFCFCFAYPLNFYETRFRIDASREVQFGLVFV